MVTYYLQHFTGIHGEEINVLRVDADGVVWTLGDGEADSGYQVWLADGNTPEEWNPEVTQPDMEEGN